MNKIKEYIKHLSTYTEESQEKALLGYVKEMESQIIDMNTEQLMDGIDSNGSPLAPYTSALYAQFKKTLNPKGVTDLKLTGETHKDFYLDTTRFPIKFENTNEKFPELQRRYGEDIAGLTQSNKENTVEELRPDVEAYYSKVFKL